MQLISTTQGGETRLIGVQGEPVVHLYQQLSQIVANRTRDKACGNLFAEPVIDRDSGEISWYSKVEGPLRRIRALEEAERLPAEKKIADIVGRISGVIDGLEISDRSDQQRLGLNLRMAMKHLSVDDLYLVGDQPVLVNWGSQSASGSSQADLMHRLVSKQVNAPVKAAVRPAVRSAVVKERRRCWFRLSYLGWLLALLVLLLLLWFVVWRWLERPQVDMPRMLDSEIALRKELDGLRGRLFDERAVCAACPVEMPPPPALEVLPEEQPVEEPIEEAVVEEEPAPPDFEQGPVTATDYCPEENIIPPNLQIVYDNSGSMAFPLNMPDDRVTHFNNRYYELLQAAQGRAALRDLMSMFGGKAPRDEPAFPGRVEWVQRNLRSEIQRYGPIRAPVAKQVLNQLVRGVPADSELGLVVFSDCNKIENVMTRSTAERKRALQIISGYQPEGATPVAGSVATAARMIDGSSPETAAVIILITDGVESCQSDPCAVARQLKATKPYAVVHVVKLGPERSSACVAETTGGKIYQPNSLEALLAAVKEARITAPFELGCSTRELE
jgi:hypothetical protein